jgi:MoxR-like ATPase
MTPKEAIALLEQRMNRSILGQEHIVKRLIMGLLADGNILIEGLPGLAKTRIVRAMADAIEGSFSRIQFTPDLVSADVIGAEFLRQDNGTEHYMFHHGPIFGNIILADEINRAPAKIQSAMLEAMAEKQVTVKGETYKLPELFIVLATQNPLQEEGTFPLSDAQKDRFFMHVKIDYTSMDVELDMIKLIQKERFIDKEDAPKIPQEMIFAARKEVAAVKLSDGLGRYIVDLVYATRYPLRYSRQLEMMIALGVSPRGSLALTQCAQAHAWLDGRDAVQVEDIQAVIHDVFRHRLSMSEHTRDNGYTYDQIIDIVIQNVKLPQ